MIFDSKYLEGDRQYMAQNVQVLITRAFIIRIICCITILIVGEDIGQLYIMSDDVMYESLVKNYIQVANYPIDIYALDVIGATGHLQVFWPYVMCFVGYICNYVFAGRFVNVILSTLAVRLIYDLTYLLGKSHSTALQAAKIYAYLPYSFLICCFPLKDIYITVAVLYAFIIFVKFQQNERIGIFQVALTVALLCGLYFARGGVVELLLLFFIAFTLKRCVERKQYGLIFLYTVIGIFVLYKYAGTMLIEAFETKIDDYGDYALLDTTISAFQMSSWYQFYKLPFAYFFASFQPIRLSLFSASSPNPWMEIISWSNLIIVPVACGNFLYIIKKKHNFLFWLCSTVMYCAVATLSLGIFRHYLFLLPLVMINYALFRQVATANDRKYLKYFSTLMYILILCFSVYSL